MKEPTDGSSFSATNLGQWLWSREVACDVEGTIQKVECKGLLRPAFELEFDVHKRQLKPIDANALNLFAVKKIHF